MDQRLRELERRFQESGDSQDEGRLLAARVQAGQLAQERLEASALLGHPGAVAAFPVPPAGNDPWRSLTEWAGRLGQLLEREGMQRAVLAEAERLLAVLARWEREPGRRLIAIEGPRAGDAFDARDLLLRSDGLYTAGLPVGTVRGTLRELEVQPGHGGVRLNGEGLSPGRHPLAHGDLIQVGDWLLIFDTEDHPEAGERFRRSARIHLDWASAWIAGDRAPPPEHLSAPTALDHRASEWLTDAVGWLREDLRASAPRSRAWPAWRWPGDLRGASSDGQLGSAAVDEWPLAIRAAAREALVPWLLGHEDPLRARARTALDRLELSYACPFAWNDLEWKAERVRHCSQCRHDVFDISSMSRPEAETLLAQHAGKRLCVRLYRRADGRVATGDCQYGLQEQPGYGETMGIVALDEEQM